MEQEKTIQINFKEVTPKDLYGMPVQIESLHEILSNTLYQRTGSIRVADIVRELFYGRSVAVTEIALSEIIGWSPGAFSPLIEVALLTYLNEKLNNLKQQQDEKEH